MRTRKRRWLILLLAAVLLLAFAAGCGQQTQPEPESSNGGLKIGYAEGTTVVEDPDALQRAVDEMYEKANEPGVTVEYKNEAYSSDGTNFTCYMANSVDQGYDVYFDIYADDELTDEIFLSGLLRPGSAFDHIELSHPLEAGEHLVYVAVTQVEEVNGEQVARGQVMHTMNFIVNQ